MSTTGTALAEPPAVSFQGRTVIVHHFCEELDVRALIAKGNRFCPTRRRRDGPERETHAAEPSLNQSHLRSRTICVARSHRVPSPLSSRMSESLMQALGCSSQVDPRNDRRTLSDQ